MVIIVGDGGGVGCLSSQFAIAVTGVPLGYLFNDGYLALFILPEIYNQYTTLPQSI